MLIISKHVIKNWYQIKNPKFQHFTIYLPHVPSLDAMYKLYANELDKWCDWLL